MLPAITTLWDTILRNITVRIDMSYWGSFLLRNCDENLVLDLEGWWLFPEELNELHILANAIGVRLIGKAI